MGRKSSKAREKKQKRLEERAAMAAVCAKVEAANKLQDPLEAFPAFKTYDRNGLNLSIECKRVAGLDRATVDWAFELTKSNMQALYERSEWGWKEREKRQELTDERAWFLVARDAAARPVAFSHFRFDVEAGDEVLYCYEVQLESRVRRRGLGKFLLQILQLVANSTRMKKVMLTVFKHNAGAYHFFRQALHAWCRRGRSTAGSRQPAEVRRGRLLARRQRLLRRRLLLRGAQPPHPLRRRPPAPPRRRRRRCRPPLRRLLPLSPPAAPPRPPLRTVRPPPPFQGAPGGGNGLQHHPGGLWGGESGHCHGPGGLSGLWHCPGGGKRPPVLSWGALGGGEEASATLLGGPGGGKRPPALSQGTLGGGSGLSCHFGRPWGGQCPPPLSWGAPGGEAASGATSGCRGGG